MFYNLGTWLIPSNLWLCLDMTEKLLTGIINHKTKKKKRITLKFLFPFQCNHHTRELPDVSRKCVTDNFFKAVSKCLVQSIQGITLYCNFNTSKFSYAIFCRFSVYV